jgi:hypothetical protein
MLKTVRKKLDEYTVKIIWRFILIGLCLQLALLPFFSFHDAHDNPGLWLLFIPSAFSLNIMILYFGSLKFEGDNDSKVIIKCGSVGAVALSVLFHADSVSFADSIVGIRAIAFNIISHAISSPVIFFYEFAFGGLIGICFSTAINALRK